MTFKERSKLAMKALTKQKPVTLEEAKAQVKRIKEWSMSKKKKFKMDPSISFAERARLIKEQLATQPPVTREEMRKQIASMQKRSKTTYRKRRKD